MPPLIDHPARFGPNWSLHPMRCAPIRGRKNRPNAATPRPEALESRQLLNSDPITATPPIIKTPLTPAQVAALPTGYTLNDPRLSPQGGGGNSPNVDAPYTPAEIRHAYGVDQLSYDGTGQTIAIVDAFDDPTIAADLTAFDLKFGLPTANFVKATPQGQPAYDEGWAGEISLDVEWAHAIAPGAKILLVESMDNGSSLFDAVTYAYQQGASQVSMSFGGGEYDGDASLDSYFNHPGTTFFASTGDSAGDVLSPSTSPYVVAVGGTNLLLDSSSNRTVESAWSDGGGGTSQFTKVPTFQQPFNGSTFRTTPDVSYDADPATGVVIDENGSFFDVGGTSGRLAAVGRAGGPGQPGAGRRRARTPLGTGLTYGTNQVLYQLAGGTGYTNSNGDFLDVTTGNNSHPAGTGYDLATGLGSPIANKLIPDLVGQLNGTPPTISVAAKATPSPVVGKTTQLSVLAADKAGEAALTYIWSTTSSPAGAPLPTFATNGHQRLQGRRGDLLRLGGLHLPGPGVQPLGALDHLDGLGHRQPHAVDAGHLAAQAPARRGHDRAVHGPSTPTSSATRSAAPAC